MIQAPLGFAPLVGTVLLAVLAAVWLRNRRYRRSDDVVHRPVNVVWVPVVVAVAGLLGAPFYAGQPVPVLLTYALALVWAAVLCVIDLDVRRLPDVLTLPAYGVVAALLGWAAVVTDDRAALLRVLTCAGAAVLLYAVAFVASPSAGGLGEGDIKLAGVLGALLGWHSWFAAVLGLLSGFMIGGLVAAVLLLARRADRRSTIPFGPAMLAGAYVWCLLGVVA